MRFIQSFISKDFFLFQLFLELSNLTQRFFVLMLSSTRALFHSRNHLQWLLMRLFSHCLRLNSYHSLPLCFSSTGLCTELFLLGDVLGVAWLFYLLGEGGGSGSHGGVKDLVVVGDHFVNLLPTKCLSNSSTSPHLLTDLLLNVCGNMCDRLSAHGA